MNKQIIKSKKRKQNLLILFSLLLLIFIPLYLIKVRSNIGYSKIGKRYVKVVDYDENNKMAEIVISSTKDELECAVSADDNKDNLNFNIIENNECSIKIPLNQHYVYFKNGDGEISDGYNINSLLVDILLKDKYYITKDDVIDFSKSLVFLGDFDVKLETESKTVAIEDLKIRGIENGNAIINFINKGLVVKTIDIVVTDVIVVKPKEFDKKKPHLSCNQFSKEQASLLDEILAYRVNESGYGTRAGAVAAARFLTLEFPYRINYFYENGRVNKTGTNYVDGEGRYYHRGMYLNEDKFEDIEESLAGPSIWGCPLTNYEPDEPKFIWGRKYPNGLDCSGFVTWALHNGGSDPGDIGTGQIPKISDYVPITDSLIYSDNIKVGDLFSAWWHISILVGIDDNHYYIAESLPNLDGVVVEKYKKSDVHYWFTHVVLMDEFYNGDGNLTDMWY